MSPRSPPKNLSFLSPYISPPPPVSGTFNFILISVDSLILLALASFVLLFLDEGYSGLLYQPATHGDTLDFHSLLTYVPFKGSGCWEEANVLVKCHCSSLTRLCDLL